MADGNDLAGIDARLFASAHHLGGVYRARLGIASRADGLAAAQAIYRLLGIDLKADPRTGDIVVRRCMFSSRYSSDICGIISALDRGLFAGLCGGGELAFSARITEGCTACRARLGEPGAPARRAIVVGSGAGGAAAARELQGAYAVTVLEAGGGFHPLSMPFRRMERLRSAGLLFDAREIGVVFPSMRVRKTGDGTIVVNGRGAGGTTTLSAGNAMRFDEALLAMGIRLDAEFEELSREVPRSTEHQETWTPATRALFDACGELGLEPSPTPKMIDAARCRRCGRCVLGCPSGAKWDSRRFLEDAIRSGAALETRCAVSRVVMDGGKAVGVLVRRGLRRTFVQADLVVLAAGGLGTPVILERSGIRCEPRLFVDPVLCVAAPWTDSRQRREIPMPFVVKRPGYVISPYFDFVSYLFDRNWRRPADGMLSLMIKLADTERGSVSRGPGERIEKRLTEADRARLAEAVELCTRIFERLGVDRREVFLGTLNAGHPGGAYPLTPADAETLHPGGLPPNLYVADASLFPASLGGPPILTIMALARRIGRICAARMAPSSSPGPSTQAFPLDSDYPRMARSYSD